MEAAMVDAPLVLANLENRSGGWRPEIEIEVSDVFP
jgi:hypothetical protein